MIKKFLFIFIHMAVLTTTLVMGFLGLLSPFILAALVAAFSLEALLSVLLMSGKLRKTASSVKHLEVTVSSLSQQSDFEERIHRELLYLGHQIKTLQTQMDSFKKIGLIKMNGNGHHKSAHI